MDDWHQSISTDVIVCNGLPMAGLLHKGFRNWVLTVIALTHLRLQKLT
jgi:hypothetical protein